MNAEPGGPFALPHLVLVGVAGDQAASLQARLPQVSVRSADTPARVVDELADGRARLLVVNHSLDSPASPDIVTRARQIDPNLPIIYLLDRRLDSEMGRQILRGRGARVIMVQPVSTDRLAGEIEATLDLETELPAANGTAEARLQDHGIAGSEPPSGGELVVESTAGSALAAAPPEPESLTGLPFLLIVDDSSDVAGRIATEATPVGIRVEVASSIVAAQRILARERPDIALLDLTFCNSTDDGLSLVERLDDDKDPVPLLFLAERDTFVDRMQAANLGGRGFLPKTYPPGEIVRAVRRLLDDLESAESRILAVDHDQGTISELTELLAPERIALTTLTDPLRFWTVLEQSAPDLLMLDVDLPRWSGIELCKVVRSETRWSTLPVVLLTTDTSPEAVQRIFAAGADDYVTKPVVGAELVTKVINRLRRMQLYRSRAEVDPLTGVANRLKGEEALGRLFRLARRQQQPFSLAILDLDDFKSINDRFGHGAGDDALRRLGSLLARTFRSEDVVARWGGEEFVVGMYGMTRAAGVQRLDDMLESLRGETPARMRNEGALLSFSGGVAQYPDDGVDLETLREAADHAQYDAKAAGKNQVLPAGESAVERPAAPPEGSDVLVIATGDDGARVVDVLRDAGCGAHWLTDGDSVSAALGSGVDRERVLLLDLDAASLDGRGILRRLARDGIVPRTRVIVLGGIAARDDVRRALDLGAFGAILKPFRPAVLLQRVREALEVL